MKINLDVNNISRAPIKKEFFGILAEKTFQNSGYKFLNPSAGGKNISVSLAIVGKSEIIKLNRICRKKNEPTDVLSFAEYKNIQQIRAAVSNSTADELFLGEVILCYDDIREYAEKRGLVFRKEIAQVFVHGLLHLLGLRHGKKMFNLQSTIINN